MTETMRPKPEVKLLGEDGNAYSIIGRCHQAAQKAGWTEEQWKKVQDEMTSGDYGHLLKTALTHFEVV